LQCRDDPLQSLAAAAAAVACFTTKAAAADFSAAAAAASAAVFEQIGTTALHRLNITHQLKPPDSKQAFSKLKPSIPNTP
jgi:hypothetical protein